MNDKDYCSSAECPMSGVCRRYYQNATDDCYWVSPLYVASDKLPLNCYEP